MGAGPDGLESDAAGTIYATDYEHHAILRRRAGAANWEPLVQDARLLWPDTLSVAEDGYLYVIANQIHRMGTFYADHVDRRIKPYMLFRVKIDAKPVRLI